MSAPAVDTELLHRRLVATSAALQGARAAFVHSPNADNSQAVETAKRRMDQLLDQSIGFVRTGGRKTGLCVCFGGRMRWFSTIPRMETS